MPDKSQVGYSLDGFETWLKQTRKSLTEAFHASMNVMAHNLDENGPVFELQDEIESSIARVNAIAASRKIILD